MNKRQFVQNREAAWQQFDRLIDQTERKTLSKLTAKGVTNYSRLLRELANDLAVVRSQEWGEELSSYLNNLVARGYNTFYRQPAGNLQRLLWFVSVGFPQVFRRNIGYFLVAAVLFFVPLGISWWVIQNNPSLASRVLPTDMLAGMEHMYGEEVADWKDDQGVFGYSEGRSAMAGFYVRNNVGIALSCFAVGILMGVGTVYILIFNGIVIGTVAGYVLAHGHTDRFLGFVITHGSFELTAIAVAGGAGLMLGNAVLHPGQRTRRESLRVRGLAAVQIAAGAAVMLMVAALIEAFWSPLNIPVLFKYLMGGSLWVLVFLYLGLAGRGQDAEFVMLNEAT